MTEQATGKMLGRGAIEQVLLELTGFRPDSAEIARALLILDTYAAGMAAAISEAPAPVIESYLHLLYQQSELLLDSGRSLRHLEEAMTSSLERVNELSGRLADDLSSRERRVELTEADRAAVRAALSEEVREMEARVREVEAQEGEVVEAQEELPQWERELLDEIAARQDAEMDQVITGAADEVAGIRDTGEVFCRTCGEWKAPEGNFFRNTKSKTGYESKCRTCRRAAKAA